MAAVGYRTQLANYLPAAIIRSDNVWVVESSKMDSNDYVVMSMHANERTADVTCLLYLQRNKRRQYRVRRIASLDAIALLTSWQSSATTPSLPTA